MQMMRCSTNVFCVCGVSVRRAADCEERLHATSYHELHTSAHHSALLAGALQRVGTQTSPGRTFSARPFSASVASVAAVAPASPGEHGR